LITNFFLFTRITIISHVREFKATLAGTCLLPLFSLYTLLAAALKQGNALKVLTR
jgi:hypothetical protein